MTALLALAMDLMSTSMDCSKATMMFGLLLPTSFLLPQALRFLASAWGARMWHTGLTAKFLEHYVVKINNKNVTHGALPATGDLPEVLRLVSRGCSWGL